MSHPGRTRQRLAVAALTLAVAMLAIAGCSEDKVTNPPPNPPAGSSTFKGTIAGSGVSGALTITVATSTPGPQLAGFRARASVTATGTLDITGGGSVALTGTHDDATHVFSVTGSGWTFTGGTTGFGLEGTFSGPGGESGVFTVQRQGTGTDTVVVIVGDFTSTTGGPGGVFNLAVRGTVIHGNAWETGDPAAIPLDGTYDPATGDISIVNPAAPTGPPLATGIFVYATGLASGTYDNGAGEAGNWAGQKQN